MKKLFLLLAMFTLTACQAPVQHSPVSVLTTIAPLYSLASQLTQGTTTQVENLIAPNTSVHSYQLTPESALALNKADLIVINGLGLETFLEESIDNAGSRVVDTSKGVEVLPFDGEEGPNDPHIWLSPKNAQIQAKNILDALVVADPENELLYKQNYESLLSKLQTLDSELLSRLESLDVKPYIVFHDAYGYFERDFDIHAVAFLEEFPGKEPSAQYLAELIELIETSEIEIAFSEPQFSPKLLQTLAEDYGLEVFPLDPLGQKLSPDGYFELLETNVDSFERAFGQKSS